MKTNIESSFASHLTKTTYATKRADEELNNESFAAACKSLEAAETNPASSIIDFETLNLQAL